MRHLEELLALGFSVVFQSIQGLSLDEVKTRFTSVLTSVFHEKFMQIAASVPIENFDVFRRSLGLRLPGVYGRRGSSRGRWQTKPRRSRTNRQGSLTLLELRWPPERIRNICVGHHIRRRRWGGGGGEQGIESPISCALHEPMVITFRLCIYAIAQLSNGVFEEHIEIRKAQLGLRPSVVLVG